MDILLIVWPTTTTIYNVVHYLSLVVPLTIPFSAEIANQRSKHFPYNSNTFIYLRTLHASHASKGMHTLVLLIFEGIKYG